METLNCHKTGARPSLQALVPDSSPSVRAVPLPKQQYRYLDIKSDELRGTFTSDAESEQRLLYYGQLDRRRHLSLEPTTPQITHHRQVGTPSDACHANPCLAAG